ncbi:MAG: hypothetical protein HY318_19715, partial [Armatimonadetes bacterium]|nr:hypothetical protein [Armatimonadota bacterium]
MPKSNLNGRSSFVRRSSLAALLACSLLLAGLLCFLSSASADRRFDFDTDLQGWTPSNFEQVEVKGGVVAGKSKFDCQLLSPILNANAADYTELVFRAKSNVAGGGEVFFSHPNDGISDKREIVHNLIGDNQFHVYHVNLASHPEWKGTIAQIRLDLLNPAGAEVMLDFVLLKKKPTDPQFTFDNEGDLEGWMPDNFEKVEVKGGALVGRTKYDCMIVSPPLSIAAKEYPELIFRARSSLSGGGELFFRHPEDTISEDRQIQHALIGDGEFHIYRVNLAAHPQWKGDIAQIRLDLLNPAGADVALDFIALKRVPGEILYNGGAELVEGGTPVQWTAKGSGATVVDESPHSGDRALRVVCKTAGDSAWIPESVDLSFLGRFEVTGFTRGATAPRVQIEFTTLGGDSLKSDAVTQDLLAPDKDWQPFRVEFNCPRRAAWAKVSLTNSNAGQVDFDDVNVRQLGRGSIVADSNAMPSWNAAWIWHPNTLKDDNTTACFRKSFNIAAVARVKTARIQITADDHFRLYANGREIAHTFGVNDAWRKPLALDLKPFLKDGKNLLAVEARDESSAQGLLAEATLVFDDEAVTEILTGGDWQASNAKDEGWNTKPDSTGDWVSAAVIAHPPSGPWGMVPYEFLGGGATLKAENFKASIDKNHVRITAAIIPAFAVRREVRVEALFSRDGKVVGRRWIPDFRIPVGATVENSVPLNADLPLPYGVSSGPLTVTLTLFGGQWQGTEPKTSLTVTAPALPQGFAAAKVIPGVAGPQLIVNGKPINPTQTWFITADELHARNASLAGVKIWSVEVDDMGWKAPDKYDYSAIDAKLRALLDVDPDVWFIITYDLSTRFQPWWIEAHPEA